MENIIIILIVLVLVGSATTYIWKEKKKGKKCIGCPFSGCCSQNDSREEHRCSCDSHF